MQGIADWLRQLGLEQHTQRFAENEIDVTVLRHLTDQDLREIGVPLGHRRKMLAAIREDVGSPTPVPAEPITDLECRIHQHERLQSAHSPGRKRRQSHRTGFSDHVSAMWIGENRTNASRRLSDRI